MSANDNPPEISRQKIWGEHLARYVRRAQNVPPPAVEGHLTRMIGLTL